MLLDFRWLERKFIAVNLVYTSRFSTILSGKKFQSPKKVRDFPIPPWDRFSVTHFSSTFSTSFLQKNLSISYELGLYCSLVNKSLVKRKIRLNPSLEKGFIKIPLPEIHSIRTFKVILWSTFCPHRFVFSLLYMSW